MAVTSVQDRTSEFRQVLAQAQRRQTNNKPSAQRQSLLTDAQKRAASPHDPSYASGNSPHQRKTDFARKAATIGRGIAATMAKLEKLAQLAKRRTLFDDRPVEVNELTFIIKQDLSALNRDISALQALSKAQHPRGSTASGVDQEGEHNRNVAILLQQRLTDVGANFQGVLEARTRNIAASKSRTENFISSVSAATQHHPGAPPPAAGAAGVSPLYGTPSRASPVPGFALGMGGGVEAADTLSLNPMVSDQQLLVMEEGTQADGSSYINQRSDAILNIEQTISELGGIFGQLAQMVQEQGNMIERIDANTEDIVDNVEGAQRELMKYWSRVSSNRWLLAKMFGVLMIFFLLWVLIAG
ncbi:Integral membrane protein SED5 [Ceratocystis fimbriata CBS 114723]|uniref:Integral membrane protein sed5 n=3 Tax=Ceratocystis TaxID=5157 RepID=A0A0F8CZ72_CERFI|nr:Integral membrane protein sed5 [Ceratocystis platani]PHH50601.1 Integral membrane protein SED5 [Ceratocystis fimbriata CBS 114723]